ncbi:MAG TPA: PF20097 family protein [Thermoplasmata archaeon]
MLGIHMKCPDCRAEMEEGYLTVPLERGSYSMKWSQEPKHKWIGGEIVYDPKKMQDSSGRKRSLWWGVPAFWACRCRNCSYVLFRYQYVPEKDYR